MSGLEDFTYYMICQHRGAIRVFCSVERPFAIEDVKLNVESTRCDQRCLGSYQENGSISFYSRMCRVWRERGTHINVRKYAGLRNLLDKVVGRRTFYKRGDILTKKRHTQTTVVVGAVRGNRVDVQSSQ